MKTSRIFVTNVRFIFVCVASSESRVQNYDKLYGIHNGSMVFLNYAECLYIRIIII